MCWEIKRGSSDFSGKGIFKGNLREQSHLCCTALGTLSLFSTYLGKKTLVIQMIETSARSIYTSVPALASTRLVSLEWLHSLYAAGYVVLALWWFSTLHTIITFLFLLVAEANWLLNSKIITWNLGHNHTQIQKLKVLMLYFNIINKKFLLTGKPS